MLLLLLNKTFLFQRGNISAKFCYAKLAQVESFSLIGAKGKKKIHNKELHLSGHHSKTSNRTSVATQSSKLL
jgi:hypothetical protein